MCCSPSRRENALYVGEVGGGEHDFDEIWRESSRVVWRAVYAFTGGHREVADDAVAEAFARAIGRDGEIRDPRAYLFRVAFRLAAAEMKRVSAQLDLVDQGREDQPELGDLLRALRRLSPSQRAAVYLHYEADLPVREVARYMGTSPAAVKVHLMRGRRRLAILLGEGEADA
jgi:RNA polymerase sigma-70 factor, ECF subfamily